MKTEIEEGQTGQLSFNLFSGTGIPVNKRIVKSVDLNDPNPLVRAIAENFPGAVEVVPPTQKWK